MSVPSAFSGGCLCGAVRYECSAPPVAMVNCHCRDCQRAGGGGYAPTVVVSRGALHVVRGEPRIHDIAAESGNTARRAFCPQCGSQVFASSSARPQFIGVKAASLDDPSWFRAAADVWTASAQPWDVMEPGTPKFSRNPERS